MSASRALAYQIDSADRIKAVSDEWISFAETNGGERLLPPGILNTSLWDWIVDPTTRMLYERLLSTIRRGAGTVRFNFRCDGPDLRRLLQMQIKVGANAEVDFQTTLIRSQPRLEIAVMDPASKKTEALLTICGWCMRIPLDGRWVEIEAAIRILGLFEAAEVPRLSHGMCPECSAAIMATLDDAELAASGQVTVGAFA